MGARRNNFFLPVLFALVFLCANWMAYIRRMCPDFISLFLSFSLFFFLFFLFFYFYFYFFFFAWSIYRRTGTWSGISSGNSPSSSDISLHPFLGSYGYLSTMGSGRLPGFVWNMSAHPRNLADGLHCAQSPIQIQHAIISILVGGQKCSSISNLLARPEPLEWNGPLRFCSKTLTELWTYVLVSSWRNKVSE